jgi:hypothetical protein
MEVLRDASGPLSAKQVIDAVRSPAASGCQRKPFRETLRHDLGLARTSRGDDLLGLTPV